MITIINKAVGETDINQSIALMEQTHLEKPDKFLLKIDEYVVDVLNERR